MALSRRIARPLLASIFVAGGLDALRNPAGKVKAAEAVTGPLSEHVSFVPSNPELLVQVNGAVQVGAGLLLASGRFRRLASVALIGSIVPTTYAGHRFWEETDDAVRAQQRIHFLKNLGLLGGLLLAATDTEGAPSLSWRAKHRARTVGQAVAVGRALTTTKAHGAAADAARVSSSAKRRAKRAGAISVHNVRQLKDSKGLDVARHTGEEAVAATRRAGSAVAAAAQELTPAVRGAAHTGADLASPYLASGVELASPYLASGVELASGLVTRLGGRMEHLTAG